MVNHSIQKVCVFSDQERKDDGYYEEVEAHAKIEKSVQSLSS